MTVATLTLIFSFIAMMFSVVSGLVSFGIIIHRKRINKALSAKAERENEIASLLRCLKEKQRIFEQSHNIDEKVEAKIEIKDLEQKITALKDEKK